MKQHVSNALQKFFKRLINNFAHHPTRTFHISYKGKGNIRKDKWKDKTNETKARDHTYHSIVLCKSTVHNLKAYNSSKMKTDAPPSKLERSGNPPIHEFDE